MNDQIDYGMELYSSLGYVLEDGLRTKTGARFLATRRHTTTRSPTYIPR